jgi:external thioesterase TEII
LLCIPFAGGQSLAFRPLAEQLPPEWGIAAIDPPGHGWCPGEPLTSVDAMVATYHQHIPADHWNQVTLVGHSLGGCVAYALADQLDRAGLTPRALILSGTRPPHRRDDYDSFLAMDDPTLLRVLIEVGGVPAEWASEPEIFDHFKAALRADFQAFEDFKIPRPLPHIPTIAIGGMQDVVCRPEHVFEWSTVTPGCRIDFVAGAHMFLQTNPRPLAQRIVDFLASLPSS